jgi:hypothetical protein
LKRTIAILAAVFLFAGLFGAVSSSAQVKYDSMDEYGEATNSALNMIKGDGVDLLTQAADGTQSATVDYLFLNKETVHGPFSTLTYEGWFGTNMDIIKVGYAIGDNDPVFKDEFKTAPPAYGTQSGVNYATGFDITIDVSGLGEEKTLVKPVVMLEDGTVLEATFLDVYYSSKPAEEEAKPEIIELTTGSGSGAFNFCTSSSVAFKINVPEGKKLVKFTISSAPTWNGPPTGIGLTATIYKWMGDFEESTDNEALDEYYEVDHKDNANLDIVYEYVPAGDYLIVCTDYTGNIGGWGAGKFVDEYASLFGYYVNGEETYPPVNCAITWIDDVKPDPTEAPATEAPTEVPTEAPVATEAPTEDTKTTDGPAATEAPKTTDAPGKDNSEKKSNTGVIIGIAVGVVAVAAVVAGAVIAKKRKK